MFGIKQVISGSDLFQNAAILEHQSGAVDLLHVWFEDNGTRQDLEWQVVVDDWDLTEEPGEIKGRRSSLC